MNKHVKRIYPHIVDHGYQRRVLKPFLEIRDYTLMRARQRRRFRLSSKSKNFRV